MNGPQLKVLAIEDDVQIQRFLAAALEAHGYELLAANTGADGLRLATVRQPHIVLVDLGLPDRSGLEVIRALREWYKGPIIVLSARSQESDKVAALDIGADDYVTKPFGIGELLARLRVAQRHQIERGGEAEPATIEIGNLLIDRASIEKFIYGRTASATANFLNAPERVRSKNTKLEFNIEKANQILEAAGWKKGADGVRAKDGKSLKFVYQTSINAPRQKAQAIVKQACQKAGIEIELKSVVASVFFSSDTANPDTYPHFYCDAQMYNTTMTQPDPQFFMNQYVTWQAATKENKWQGRNVSRWQSKEYDEVYKQAEHELDAVKRAAMFIKLNDLVVADNYILPLLRRPKVTALSGNLIAHLTGWDNDLYQIANWYRET